MEKDFDDISDVSVEGILGDAIDDILRVDTLRMLGELKNNGVNNGPYSSNGRAMAGSERYLRRWRQLSRADLLKLLNQN